MLLGKIKAWNNTIRIVERKTYGFHLILNVGKIHTVYNKMISQIFIWFTVNGGILYV